MLGNGFGWLLLMRVCVHLVLGLPQFCENCDGKPWFHSQPHGFHYIMRSKNLTHDEMETFNVALNERLTFMMENNAIQ